MSFLSGGSWTSDPRESEPRHVEQRRATRDGRVAEATLACPHCDAPVALQGASVGIGTDLGCPFCGHTGRVRDFLSLARPTRPARVVVRIGR